jgi:uncharacterized protein (DUF2461 family)
LDKDGVQIYSGMYEFSPEELRAFRRAVADEKKGGELQRKISALEKNRGFGVGGETYTRVPKGYEPGHKRAELLKYASLYAISPLIKPTVVSSPKLVDECHAYCKVMFGLTEWLMRMKESAY